MGGLLGAGVRPSTPAPPPVQPAPAVAPPPPVESEAPKVEDAPIEATEQTSKAGSKRRQRNAKDVSLSNLDSGTSSTTNSILGG